MSRTTCLLITGLVGVCLLASARAQGLAGEISSASKGGPLNKPGDLLGGAQLLAANGNSSATIKLSKVTSIVEAGDVARFNTWSLTASAPLDKSGKDAIVANLDGLASAASVEFAFTSFSARGVHSAKVVKSKLPTLDAICRRAHEARKALDQTPVPETLDCDSDFVSKYGSSDDQHAYESVFWELDKDAYRWLWGATAKAGFQNYEFVTVSATATQKTSGKPWSIGLWGGFQPGDREVLLTLNAQYQRAMEEGDASTVCPVPSQSATSTVCVTGPLDAPKEVTKRLLTAEARARISGFGVAFSLTRDFAAKTTGVEIPIYFWTDKDGKLTAGLKVGWTSKKNETAVGVFIGTPFALFK